MAAPFLSQHQQASDSYPSAENGRRGREPLHNAHTLRMPEAFAGRMARSKSLQRPASGGTREGGTINNAPATGKVVSPSPDKRGDATALRTIDGNSPPRSAGGSNGSKPRSRSASPSSPRSRPVQALSNRRKGQQRGRLGAVKLAASPPSRNHVEPRGRLSCSPTPVSNSGKKNGNAKAVVSPGDSLVPPLPPGPSVQGRMHSRRQSMSASPPRRRLLADAIAKVLPFGGSGTPLRAWAEGACEPTGNPGKDLDVTPSRRRGGAVVEGSRVDLRELDRAKGGGGKPRAYRCQDGSVIVLGRSRMLSVRPDGIGGADAGAVAETTKTTASEVGGSEAAGRPRDGVVTWVMGYGELESCCINVSAGKNSERSVGDVVVEITSRYAYFPPPNGRKRCSYDIYAKPAEISSGLFASCLETL